ncbi:hypothetical protein MMPV_003846 [Pyropia vietnamensis]
MSSITPSVPLDQLPEAERVAAQRRLLAERFGCAPLDATPTPPPAGGPSSSAGIADADDEGTLRSDAATVGNGSSLAAADLESVTSASVAASARVDDLGSIGEFEGPDDAGARAATGMGVPRGISPAVSSTVGSVVPIATANGMGSGDASGETSAVAPAVQDDGVARGTNDAAGSTTSASGAPASSLGGREPPSAEVAAAIAALRSWPGAAIAPASSHYVYDGRIHADAVRDRAVRVTPITRVATVVAEAAGARVAVDSALISYAVGSHVRVISRASAARCLLRGHSAPIVDMQLRPVLRVTPATVMAARSAGTAAGGSPDDAGLDSVGLSPVVGDDSHPAALARKRKWMPNESGGTASGGEGGAGSDEAPEALEDAAEMQLEHVLVSCAADGSVRFWRLAVRGGDGDDVGGGGTPGPASPANGSGTVGCIGKLALSHPSGGRYNRLCVSPRYLPTAPVDDDDEADGEVVVALADEAPGGGIRLVWARLPPGGDEDDGGDDSKVGEGEASVTREVILHQEGKEDGGKGAVNASAFTALAWVNGGRFLAAGDSSGNVVVWDVDSSRMTCVMAPFADWPDSKNSNDADASTPVDSADCSVLSLAVLAGGHALLAADSTGRRLSLLTVAPDGRSLSRTQTLEFGIDTTELGACLKDGRGTGGGASDTARTGGNAHDDSDEDDGDDSSTDSDNAASDEALHWCPFASETSGELTVGWNVRSRCLYLLHYCPRSRRIDGLVEAALRAPVLSAAPTLAARHVALTGDGGVPRAGSVREMAVWAVTPAAVQLLHLPVDDLLPPPDVVAAAAVVAKAVSTTAGGSPGSSTRDGSGADGVDAAPATAEAAVDGSSDPDTEAGVETKKARVGWVPLSPVVVPADMKFSAGSTAGGGLVDALVSPSSDGGGARAGASVSSPRPHKSAHAVSGGGGGASSISSHRGVRSPRGPAVEVPPVEPQHILFNKVTAVPPVVLPPSTQSARPPPAAAAGGEVVGAATKGIAALPSHSTVTAAATVKAGRNPSPRTLPTSPATSTLLPRLTDTSNAKSSNRSAPPSLPVRPPSTTDGSTAKVQPPSGNTGGGSASGARSSAMDRALLTTAVAPVPDTSTIASPVERTLLSSGGVGLPAPTQAPTGPTPEQINMVVKAAERGAADAAATFAASAAARDAEDEVRLETLLSSVGTTMDGAISSSVTSAIHTQMATVVVPALASLLRPAAVPPPKRSTPPIDVDALAGAVASALTLSASTAAAAAGSGAGGGGGGGTRSSDAWLTSEYEAAMRAARLADAASAAADAMSRQIAASVRAGVQAAAATSVAAPLRDVCEATAEAEAALAHGAATVAAAAAAVAPAGGVVSHSGAADAAAAAAIEAEAAAAAAAAAESAAAAARLERRAEVERAAAADDVEAAFVAALDGGDWPLLRWLLSSLDAQRACESGRLSQVALVSLLQQLGVGLVVPTSVTAPPPSSSASAAVSAEEAAAEAVSDTRLRVLWLHEALQAVDTAAAESRAYLPGILDLLQGRLDTLLAAGPAGTAGETKKVRVCLYIVKSLRTEV